MEMEGDTHKHTHTSRFFSMMTICVRIGIWAFREEKNHPHLRVHDRVRSHCLWREGSQVYDDKLFRMKNKQSPPWMQCHSSFSLSWYVVLEITSFCVSWSGSWLGACSHLWLASSTTSVWYTHAGMHGLEHYSEFVAAWLLLGVL